MKTTEKRTRKFSNKKSNVKAKQSIMAKVKADLDEPTLVPVTSDDIFNEDDDSKLCEICVTNKYNYVCTGCKCKMCNECLQKYILDFANLAPHCMNCQALLPFAVIYNAIGKEGFKEYLEKAAQLKFELELQKAPDCMSCCSMIKRAASLAVVPKDLLSLLYNCSMFNSYDREQVYPDNYKPSTKTEEIVYKLDDIYFDARIQILNELKEMLKFPLPEKHRFTGTELNVIRTVSNRCRYCASSISCRHPGYDERLEDAFKPFINMKPSEFRSIGYDINTLSDRDKLIKSFELSDQNKELGRARKTEYLFKCSYKDCKGLVNCKFECELCRHKYCEKCFKLFDENEKESTHTCNADDIATAEDIMKNTRPCPKCAARIFKISGCSQMFCTNCHCSFDWNTGKLVHGNFHNPHRAAWLQQHNLTGEEFEEFNCNNNNTRLEGIVNRSYLECNVCYLHRLYESNYFREILRKYRTKIDKLDVDIFKNRCLYLINELSKDAYLKYLKKNVKDHHRLDMIFNIYNGYSEIINTIVQTVCNRSIDFINTFIKKETNYNDAVAISLVWKTIIRFHDTSKLKELINQIDDTKIDKLQDAWINALQTTYTIDENFDYKVFSKSTYEYWWLNKRDYSLNDAIVAKYIKVFRDMPTINDEIVLMDKITEETRNDIKLYKTIFGIGKLSMPITSTTMRKRTIDDTMLCYYDVC